MWFHMEKREEKQQQAVQNLIYLHIQIPWFLHASKYYAKCSKQGPISQMTYRTGQGLERKSTSDHKSCRQANNIQDRTGLTITNHTFTYRNLEKKYLVRCYIKGPLT